MFGRARLKLTVWYLLIIMLISVGFSIVIYKVSTIELDRFSHLQRLRIEKRLNEGGFIPFDIRIRSIPQRILTDLDLIEETKRRLILFLAIINGGIFIISGGLAYFLAGKTLKPIKEMVDEQNQFISDASHELKTPLTSLKSAMEVHLRDKKMNLTDSRKLISENIEEVNKLQSLTEKMLQLAQYQKSNNNFLIEKIVLSEVVNKAIQSVKSYAIKKKITFENRTFEIQFKGDKYSIYDLFVILLDNAIKYSPMGSKVILQSKKKGGSVLISVSDEGIGIEKKDLPHIFDRFFRSDSARTKIGKDGYGLGLSIAKKIVNLHHGSISAASKINKGSVFTVLLPVNQNFS